MENTIRSRFILDKSFKGMIFLINFHEVDLLRACSRSKSLIGDQSRGACDWTRLMRGERGVGGVQFLSFFFCFFARFLGGTQFLFFFSFYTRGFFFFSFLLSVSLLFFLAHGFFSVFFSFRIFLFFGFFNTNIYIYKFCICVYKFSIRI